MNECEATLEPIDSRRRQLLKRSPSLSPLSALLATSLLVKICVGVVLALAGTGVGTCMCF